MKTEFAESKGSATLISRVATRGERGFTLMETSIAMVVMMVVGLGAASLFAYSTRNNMSAEDREVATSVVQRRIEWLRTIPFSDTNRSRTYSYPGGGLAATATPVTESVIVGGRPFRIVTTIQDQNTIDGLATRKIITVQVIPGGSSIGTNGITVTTQRSALTVGPYSSEV
jgi:Tfp pilus assembly protein PilV